MDWKDGKMVKMSGEKEVLPVVMPPVTCLQYESHLFAVLYANPKFVPWIYSNYIQLWMHKTNGAIYGNYVIAPVEHGTLREAFFEHVAHETMVYGYDCQNQLFYLADFVQGKYQFFRCSFEEFRNSYQKGYQESDLVWSTFRLWRIETQKYFHKESIRTFDGFRMHNVLRLLEDYYAGFNSYEHYGWICSSEEDDIANRKYGVRCYDELGSYVADFKDIKDCRRAYIMPFYLFYAQKKLMELRLDYIDANVSAIPERLNEGLHELRVSEDEI